MNEYVKSNVLNEHQLDYSLKQFVHVSRSSHTFGDFIRIGNFTDYPMQQRNRVSIGTLELCSVNGNSNDIIRKGKIRTVEMYCGVGERNKLNDNHGILVDNNIQSLKFFIGLKIK